MPHRMRLILVSMFCILLFLSMPGAALARQTLTTYGPSGRPFLQFDIYDQGEEFGSVKFDLEGENSAWTMGSGHLSVLKNASDYWSALWGTAPRNTAPVRIIVGTVDYPGAGANPGFTSPPDTELAQSLLQGGQGAEPTAIVHLGFFSASPYTDYFGSMSVLPANGNSAHLASALAHELGHAMGMFSSIGFVEPDNGSYRFGDNLSAWDEHLVDSFGNKLRAGMEVYQGSVADAGAFVLDDTNYDPYAANFGGNAYFQGPETMQALGGAGVILPGHSAPGLPVSGFEPYLDAEGNLIDFPELSHIELRNSLMSHQYYRNWGTLMEAELAVLQDIGLPVDRKNFFGESIYTDNNNLDLHLAFYARNAQGTAYLPGTYNSAPLAVGLHVYGRWNNLNVSGEALSTGYGGVGIRVDGWENTLNIDPAARIHALGEGGTGLMIAYGKGHSITQRGEVAATGPGGVGARFDFGNNMMGNDNDYRGSYIHSYAGENGELLEDTLYDELNGPLVENFDLTGTLAGGAAAMYISENAYVENIHIMQGARLFGDIISHWDPESEHIQYEGDPGDLHTSLTFGLMPDADGKATATGDSDFFLDYRGNITGEKSMNVSLDGGTLAYGGQMNALSFTAKSGSSLLVVPNAEGVLINAADIELEAGSTVGLYTDSVSYGAPLAVNQAVLRLTGGNISENSALQAPSGPFIHGFYDYTPISLGWDGQNLMLGSSRTFSQERAGTSAITAPTAIMVQNPYARLLHDRVAKMFAQSLRDKEAGGDLGRAVYAGTGFDVAGSGEIESGGAASDGTVSGGTTSGEPLSIEEDEAHKNSESLWVVPGYGNARRYGSNHYTVSTPGLALGWDMPVDEAAFFGVGAYLGRPAYRSDDTDIDAENYTVLVYGGALLEFDLELDAFAAFGHTGYEQNRKVHGERYAADYSSKQLGAGVALGRSFELGEKVLLRPFTSYELMYLNVDGYNEGRQGYFGLEVDENNSTLHRLQAGTTLAYTLDENFIEGRVFYSGLYGDRQPEADIRMTNDPSGYTMHSQGWAEDKHALGLGINVGIELWDTAELSGGYSFVGGKNTASHQAELTLSIAF